MEPLPAGPLVGAALGKFPALATSGICMATLLGLAETVVFGSGCTTVEWPQAAPLDVVRVRSGYSAGVPSDSVLRDFTVQLRTAEGWTPIASVAGNVSGEVVVDAKNLTADAVRLLITDPSASATDVARVYEVEAIAAG